MAGRILVLVMVLALAACGPRAPAPPQAPAAPAPPPAPSVESRALSAEGWGPLRIGMTREAVVAALGDNPNPGGLVASAELDACDEFRPERAPVGLRVMIENGALARISLDNESTLRTDRNLGPGDDAAAVKAAYGAAAVVAPHKYEDPPAEYVTTWARGAEAGAAYVANPDARGIRYEIGSDAKVAGVHAGGPAIQYVEGCS